MYGRRSRKFWKVGAMKVVVHYYSPLPCWWFFGKRLPWLLHNSIDGEWNGRKRIEMRRQRRMEGKKLKATFVLKDTARNKIKSNNNQEEQDRERRTSKASSRERNKTRWRRTWLESGHLRRQLPTISNQSRPWARLYRFVIKTACCYWRRQKNGCLFKWFSF